MCGQLGDNKPETTKGGNKLKNNKYSFQELERIGFEFDKNGKVSGLNANVFAQALLKKKSLVYCENGFFYIYRGNIYKKLSHIMLSRMLMRFLHRYIKNTWCSSKESEYIAVLRRKAPYVRQFDMDRSYLNLKNGLFDLETFELIEHDPYVRTSIRLPINYDPNADCPRFKKFLSEIFLANKRVLKIIQEVLGYCLTSSVQAEKAFLFIGSGANGKSTLIHVINMLLGKANVSTIPLADLEKPFQRHELAGKLVNFASENEFSRNGFNSQYFKAIVSGDPIAAEIKYGATYTFEPFCKIIMAMNSLPITRDLTDGLKRKMLIIPFDAQFKGKKADKYLKDKLKNELNGIFNFAIKGLKRLIANDYEFTKSSKIDKVLEDYFGNIDPLYGFVKDAIVADSSGKEFYKDLFEGYCNWIRHKGGEAQINRLRFTVEIKSRLHSNGIPFTLGKSKDRYIKGIRLVKRKYNHYNYTRTPVMPK